jgi:hypothetical protein
MECKYCDQKAQASDCLCIDCRFELEAEQE